MMDPISNKTVLDTVDCILAVGRLSDRAEQLVRSPDWSTVNAQRFVVSEFAPLYQRLSKVFPSSIFVQVLVTALLIKAAEQASPEALERLTNIFPIEAKKREHVLLYFGSRIMFAHLESDVEAEIQSSLAGYL